MWMAGQTLAVFATKHDPDFAPILIRHLQQKDGFMLNLREYRHNSDRLADHLPWAALVAPGMVLNKDGSFQHTLRFRGPDLESATEAELVGTYTRLSNVLRRFGSSWALFFEAERFEAPGYPESSFRTLPPS